MTTKYKLTAFHAAQNNGYAKNYNPSSNSGFNTAWTTKSLSNMYYKDPAAPYPARTVSS